MTPTFVKDFKDLSKSDVAIAGGKGASLGEMTQSGIAVPPGFVVLATSFEQFIKETGLDVEIEAALHAVSHKDLNSVETTSEKIRALILNAQFPADIAKEVIHHFQELNAKYVAVRSSATAEDSTTASWAGELESYLNTTEENLLETIKKCWSSLFTPRAIFYRFEKELHTTNVSVAVVVQAMVQSEVSGICFTVHPVTEDPDQMVIEAGFGLGEAIVGGIITPDTYVVHKTTREILECYVSEQHQQIIKTREGTQLIDVPKDKRGEVQKLSNQHILELADLCLKIESHYGFPCDIEWAWANDTFYITQSRPITTLTNTKVIQ